MLHEFLTANTPEIIVRVQRNVDARKPRMPSDARLKSGIPLFLRQLIDRLSAATTDNQAIDEGATQYGGELLALGLTVSQVVHAYGDVCQVMTELADEQHAPISTDEFHTFNRCIDDATAHAVTEYQRRRDESVAQGGAEGVGLLAEELLNRLTPALLAFSVLQDGTVGIGGSTGAVLGRSLRSIRDLGNNALASARLDAGLGKRHRVSIAEIIENAESEAAVIQKVSGCELLVSTVSADVDVEADRQILVTAIDNLLQNAFELSRPQGHVALRAIATASRVRIEVEVERSYLAPGMAEDGFRPFEQQNDKYPSLGLRLAISRKGVEAVGGTLSARDLTGKGCVFAIELPRMAAG